MTSDRITPLLDCGSPGTLPTRSYFQQVAPEVATFATVAASLATVAWSCKLANLWCAEVGSGCGTVRLGIKADLLLVPCLVGVAALGIPFTSRTPTLRVTCRLATLAAAAAWATVFVWVNVQR